MISITLNFKSIEAARAALLEIPLSALAGGEDSKQAAEVKPAKTAKPAKQEPAQDAAPAPGVKAEPQAAKAEPQAAKAEPQAAEAPAEAPAEEQPTAVDYPTLQKAVFALAAINREAVIATAGAFGVKTFKELDQSKWAAALEAVQAKVAELKAAA